MRFTCRLAAVLLGIIGACLQLAPIAAQAAPSVDVDEVVGALGLASEPADYVLLIDTSGSMNQGGRFQQVRSQLRTLLAGLDSDDRVALLTFDSTVVRRYRGTVGTNPNTVLAHLPATATGTHTDIGAAIHGGLAELERADTYRLAALILITDGVMDTVPTAKYAKVGSAAWKKLKTRSTSLGKSHELAAYAVSLISTTDAGLLKKAMPRATEVSADEVGTRFAQVADDLVHLQAAKALKDELAVPINVTFTGELGAALADGTTVPLQWRSGPATPMCPLCSVTCSSKPAMAFSWWLPVSRRRSTSTREPRPTSRSMSASRARRTPAPQSRCRRPWDHHGPPC